MTPEVAKLGLEILPNSINTTPKSWCYKDYPNLKLMKVFN